MIFVDDIEFGGEGDFEVLPESVMFTHTYAKGGSYPAKITGKEGAITVFAAYSDDEMINSYSMLALRGCTQLVYLACPANQLTSLDVSKNTQLKHLDCGYCPLTVLDVSKNTQLTGLGCDNNRLTATAMNKIYTDLPTWPENSNAYISASRSTAGDYSIPENKGWHVNLSDEP